MHKIETSRQLNTDEFSTIFSFISRQDYVSFSHINSKCHSIVESSGFWKDRKERRRDYVSPGGCKFLTYCIPISINIFIHILIFTPIFFITTALCFMPLQQCRISNCDVIVRETCVAQDSDDACIYADVTFMIISLTAHDTTLKLEERFNSERYNQYGCVNESFKTVEYLHDCYYYDNGLFSLSFTLERKCSGELAIGMVVFVFVGSLISSILLISFCSYQYLQD